MRALPLRPYQRQALDAWRSAGLKRSATVLPTGAGKTVVFAHQALEWIAEHPGDRVLVLVDTEELAFQTVGQLQKIAPKLSIGLVKAAKNQIHADVLVGSVQTLRNPKRMTQVTCVGLLIVDECEAATAPSYQAILAHFSDATVVGYTATLMRSDGAALAQTWPEVTFSRDISWMIRHRFLIPPRGIAVVVPDLDLRTVKSTRADYRDEELGDALAGSLAPEVVAQAVLEHAKDRKTLAFFPTVSSCYVFAEALEAAGVEARVIHGGLAPADRKAVLAWHRRGTVLVNCMILTKGYDDPEVDCVLMGRPTKSKRLYIQIVGRGLRVDPARPYDEQDCLLLDVVGIGGNHDLRSNIDLSERPISDPRDGSKTLVELEDELDAGDGVPEDETPYWTGDVVSREFDPIGAPSTKVWLRTKGKTFFVPAGKSAYVFIMEYPERGRWTVAWCGQRSADRPMPGDPRPVGTIEPRGLPLDQALVWAEDLALELGADLNTANKTAPWRRKRASEAMVSRARRLGLTVEMDGLIPRERMGQLSDRMDEVTATRRIDPIVQAVRNR